MFRSRQHESEWPFAEGDHGGNGESYHGIGRGFVPTTPIPASEKPVNAAAPRGALLQGYLPRRT
ncbi:MAG TPA: hypothetical protein VMN03_02340 [Burkholderiales bacterium]|nr:hypothetical protein [Burkholderiales bacterium]